MRISVTAPIEQALNHTKAILFDDFRFRMWLGLGFCAFLANLQFTFPNFSGDSLNTTPLEDWFRNNTELAVVLLLFAVIFGLGLWALMLWLQCRGKFMFLDGVLNDSGAVKEPWRRFQHLANNLFLFQILVLGAVIGVTVVLVLVIGLGVALENGGTGSARAIGIGLIAGGIGFVILLVLVYSLLLFIIECFLVPAMYRRNARATEALSVLSREVLRPYAWNIFLFLLMTMLLGLASFILVMIGMCITCCVAALPYVTYVVFLPIFVFFRLYTVYFLEQFGPDWRFFAREGDGAPPAGGSDPDPLDAIMDAPEGDPFQPA